MVSFYRRIDGTASVLRFAASLPAALSAHALHSTQASGGGGPSLADVANLFVIGGFVLTLAAATFAGWQLRQQALVQKFNAVLETNRLWWDAPTVRETMRAPSVLSGPTLDLIAEIYEHLIVDRKAALGRWAAPRPDAAQGVPYLLAAMFPTGTSAPTSEEEYRSHLLDRALCVGIVLSVLRQVADGEDVSQLMPVGRPGPSVVQAVKAELAELSGALERYVNALNEVVELYEARMIDRHLFLGKRHVAIIQQLFVVEPYLLWRNTVYPGRWGMRLLAIGQAARAYHWTSSLHSQAPAQPLSLRGGPERYGRGSGGEAALVELAGPIIAPSSQSAQSWRPLRRLRRALGAGFSSSDKQCQSELGGRVLGSDRRGLDAWLVLAADADAQRGRRAAFHDRGR